MRHARLKEGGEIGRVLVNNCADAKGIENEVAYMGPDDRLRRALISLTTWQWQKRVGTSEGWV